MDSKEFAARADDNALTAARIEMLNYDAAFPTGTIHLYPIPNAALTLELWVWEQLSAISDFTLTISFPPGYLKTIIYNLAVDLANRFPNLVAGVDYPARCRWRSASAFANNLVDCLP